MSTTFPIPKILIQCVLLMVFCFCMKHGISQDTDSGSTEGKPPYSSAPVLESLFVDRFETDSRENYQFEGTVDWVEGAFALSNGCKLIRRLDAGPWLRMELDLEFPELTQERQESDVKIWFNLGGSATDCYLRLHQQNSNGKTTSKISFYDTDGQFSESPKPLLVRTREFDSPLSSGNWTIEYTRGHCKVSCNSNRIFNSFVQNLDAKVSSVVLQCEKSKLQLSKMEVATDSHANLELLLDPESVTRMKKLERDYPESLRLIGVRNYRKAAELGLAVRDTQRDLLGEFHGDYCTNLNNLAICFRLLRDFEKSEQFVSKALELREKIVGKEHPDYADSLISLASVKHDTGSTKEAEAIYLQVLAIREQAFGKASVKYADGALRLGRMYLSLGNRQKAEAQFLDAKTACESDAGEGGLLHAEVLNSLSEFYQSRGNYRKALEQTREAARVFENRLGKDSPNYGVCQYNLARLYYVTGAFEQSVASYSNAITIFEKISGRENLNYIANVNGLASVYTTMGEFQKAEPLLLEAHQLYAKISGKEHLNYARSLEALATFYFSKGAYEKSEPLYLEALELYGRTLGKTRTNYAACLNGLALNYRAMHTYEKAEPLFLEALTIYENATGKEHRDYAANLANLAGLYTLQGLYEKAEPLLVEALEINERTVGKENFAYLSGLSSLAANYKNQGLYDKAEPLYLRVMAIYEGGILKDSLSNARNMNNLGQLYTLMGQYEKAEALFLTAQKNYEAKLGRGGSVNTLNSLGRLYFILDSFEAAEQYYRRCIEHRQARLGEIAAIQSEAQQRKYQTRFSSEINFYLSIAAKTGNYQTSAFELVTNWNGAVQIRQSRYRELGSQSDTKDLFDKLNSVSQQLYVHLNKSSKSRGWNERRENLSVEKETIEKQLAAQSATFRSIKEPVTLRQIQDSIPANSALVNLVKYTHYERENNQWKPDQKRLLAFLVHKDKPLEMIELGPVDSLSQTIEDFRSVFTSDPDDISKELKHKSTFAAQALRNSIWNPIEAKLGDIETVIISPYGELGMLPFAVLPAKDPKKYLIEEYNILTLPVAQLLPSYQAPLNEQDRPSGDLLLVGNVDYSQASNEAAPRRKKRRRRGEEILRAGTTTWENLDETEGEIATIKKLFFDSFESEQDAVTTLEKAQASEARFSELAPKFEMLHIATHGFFAPPQYKSIDSVQINQASVTQADDDQASSDFLNAYHPGLLSGLVFAGANQKIQDLNFDDGIMTADEISFLPLKGVDLVTLSACETAIGKSAGGEGLIGIQRAFQISGARSVVASLWKVDDTATRVLMQRFYKNMFEKDMGKLDALTEAQRWMLNNSDSVRGKKQLSTQGIAKRTHPRYWAAWTLSGDWR